MKKKIKPISLSEQYQLWKEWENAYKQPQKTNGNLEELEEQ